MSFCTRKHNVECIYTMVWLIFSPVFITLLFTFYTLSGPKAVDSYNLVDDCGWLQAVLLSFREKSSDFGHCQEKEYWVDRQRFGLSTFVLVFLQHLKLAVCPSKRTRNASPVCWVWFPVPPLSCKFASNTSQTCSSPIARMTNLDAGSEQWYGSCGIQIGQCLHCGY